MKATSIRAGCVHHSFVPRELTDTFESHLFGGAREEIKLWMRLMDFP